MSQVPNRSELERLLARVISKEQRAELERLIELLGNPPLLENVPPEFWASCEAGLLAAIEPQLTNIYLLQAEAFMADIGIGISWDLINQGAVNFARTYGYNLVKEIRQNTQSGVADILSLLQQEIPTFYETGVDLEMLESRLMRWFGPVRAEMIAVTETTRAATEAERLIVEELFKTYNIRMIPYWNTENDERVCPICAPRDGKEIKDNIYPPAHPRCRCWTTYRMPK